MSMKEIRKAYGLEHKVGDQVKIKPGSGNLGGLTGKLLRAQGAHLVVKGGTWKGVFHPTDVLAVQGPVS